MSFIDKLVTKIKENVKISDGKEPFPSGCFEGELARKTEWSPIATSTANTCTHRLEPNFESGDLSFVMTKPLRFTIYTFAFVAFIVFPTIFFLNVGVQFLPKPKDEFMIAGGLLISVGICGIAMFFLVRIITSLIAVATFSSSLGAYYKASPRAMRTDDYTTLPDYTPFSKIGAFQILKQSVLGTDSSKSYISYELNIVRKDGTRVFCLSHGNYEKLREDVDILASQFHVPVWDVVERNLEQIPIQ